MRVLCPCSDAASIIIALQWCSIFFMGVRGLVKLGTNSLFLGNCCAVQREGSPIQAEFASGSSLSLSSYFYSSVQWESSTSFAIGFKWNWILVNYQRCANCVASVKVCACERLTVVVVVVESGNKMRLMFVIGKHSSFSEERKMVLGK